jgi:hypothetical protein
MRNSMKLVCLVVTASWAHKIKGGWPGGMDLPNKVQKQPFRQRHVIRQAVCGIRLGGIENFKFASHNQMATWLHGYMATSPNDHI